MSNISSVLKARRKEFGLTLAQIADEIGVTEATVQRWESGNIKSLRHERITKLANILKVSPSTLMGWESSDLSSSLTINSTNTLDSHSSISPRKFLIKEAREAAGYTQKELAALIGVAPNTFHGYESGKHDPKSDLLLKIAKACGTTVDFLLGRTKEKSSDSADANSEDALITMEESNALLVKLGYIKEGEQLSDEDLAFLTHLIGLLDTWFNRR